MYTLGIKIIEFRLLILLFVVGCLASGSLFLNKLYFDNSVEAFFLEGDQHEENYNQFLETFGSDEYFVVMLYLGEKWKKEQMLLLNELAEELSNLENVEEIKSIINIYEVNGSGDEIEVDDFISKDQLFDQNFNPVELKEIAIHNKAYTGLYINDSGEYLSIVGKTPIIKGEIQYKIDLASNIRDIIYLDKYQSLDPHLAGSPILDADVRDIVSKESSQFMFIAIIVVALGYWFVFRSILAAILPIMVSLLSTYAAFCISGAMGAPLGILTSIIPAFLMSVGATASVYLQTELFLESHDIIEAEKVNPKELIARAFSKAVLPSVLSGATTAGALLAFSSSSVRPVMEVGVVMGAGLLVAITLTVLLLPIAYSYKSNWKVDKRQRERMSLRVARMRKIAEFVVGKRNMLLSAAIALTIVSLIGVSKLNVDYFYLGVFKSYVPIKQNFDKIDDVLANSSTIEIVITAEDGGSAKSVEIQKYMEGLANHIESYERVPLSSLSSIDLIKDIHRAFSGGDEQYYRLPESSEKIADLIFLFELGGGDELEKIFSVDDSQTRFTVYLPNQKNSKNVEVETYIRSYFIDNPYDIHGIDSVDLTGITPLWTVINNYLLDSQIQSTLFAVIIVFIAMCLIFRSLILAGTMCLGNALAIIWVLGFMGFIGINLDPYTILISAIAIGILDDDTIHFVKRYQREIKIYGNEIKALSETYKSTGQAIFYFSGVLIVAFSSYILSDVKSLTNFGLLISITILLGMIVEFFVNPAVLLFIGKNRLMGLKKEQVIDNECVQEMSS